MDHDLWDGCIVWSLPPGFTYVDARTIRDFPQNQEVFLGPVDRGDAFMFDLMALMENMSPQQVLREHWEGLLEANEATEDTSVPQELFTAFMRDPSRPAAPDNMMSVPCVVGVQVMTATGTHVRVWLCLVRLASVHTDVIITWNQPPSAVFDNPRQVFAQVLASVRWIDISFMDL
jgi:hypothetical protein